MDRFTDPVDPDTYESMGLFEVRYCRQPKLMIFGRPQETDGAAVIDGSEYYADFVTGPDFGCVNWQERGDETQLLTWHDRALRSPKCTRW